MKAHRAGLSVLEIIVALGLVTTVALTIIGLFSRLMASSSKGADQAAAELLAQAVLDRATRTGPPDWGGLSAGVELETAETSSSTRYVYQVQIDPLPDDTHPLGVLYRVGVQVRWSGRQDQGRLLVERSRLTYVEGAPSP